MTNATSLQAAMMAFNTLLRIGQEILALVKERSRATVAVANGIAEYHCIWRANMWNEVINIF
jgi:hypothetical protein